MLHEACPFVAYKAATAMTPEIKAQGWNEDCLIFCTNNLPKDQTTKKYLMYLECLRYAVDGGCPRPKYVCKINFMGCIGQLCARCPAWVNKVVESLPALEWVDDQKDLDHQLSTEIVRLTRFGHVCCSASNYFFADLFCVEQIDLRVRV